MGAWAEPAILATLVVAVAFDVPSPPARAPVHSWDGNVPDGMEYDHLSAGCEATSCQLMHLAQPLAGWTTR